MTEWAVVEDRLCGYGEQGSVTLEADGWRPGGNAPRFPLRLDVELAGTAEAIRLPVDGEPILRARSSGTSGDRTGQSLDPGRLPDGRHCISVRAEPETHVIFDGPATVEADDGPWVRFPTRTAVGVGFRGSSRPRPFVRVPESASGLATAVTAAGNTHSNGGPERSHPGFRPPTPRVAFGDRSVPDELDVPGDGSTMTVPDSVPAVLVAAPLAYYVGADLRIGPDPPMIRGDGLEYEFEPMPAFADDVATAVRGLCTLDSRLRSIPGESGPLISDDLAHLASANSTQRLATVLESPPELSGAWPLTTYVDDDVANGRYLPYLLDRFSLVRPASSAALDPKTLLQRSLDEFYRGETPNVEAVDPTLGDSRFHAWLGDGTPVDAYTLLWRAGSEDERAERALESKTPTEVGVDVVCNDPAMASEQRVAEEYRSRLSELDATVRVHERLSTSELAAVFERPTDLVHFVGHCEVDGLVCPDGTLAAADLESCAAESFFLNACGSYYEGYDFVRNGATVGAVTLSTVLDEQAVSLGTTFAALLADGFAFDRALALARGEIIVGRDYVVVGDGTHRLRAPRGTNEVLDLSRDGTEEAFTLRSTATAPDRAGGRYLSVVDGREHLWGQTVTQTLERRRVVEKLRRISVPVRYDGSLEWSDELAARLEATERQG